MARANMRDLSFATFNLRNLQVPGGVTYGPGPDLADDAAGRAAYDRRIAWIAAQIRRLDARIIGFQELWARQALVDAFDRAGLTDAYDLIARDAPGRGRPQVALAVRKDRRGRSLVDAGAGWIAAFPPSFRLDGLRETDGAEEEITVTVDAFSRPLLRATIRAEGVRPTPPPVTVLVAHLKSKGPARLSFARPRAEVLDRHPSLARSAASHIRRVMEAGALRVLLDEITAPADDDALSPTVVLGDLNDDTLSVTNEMISAQPTYRVAAKGRAGSRTNRGLYSVERLQQFRSMRHVYYTYIYKHKRESLDHILVSEEFYDHSLRRQWSFREMEVYNDHLNRPELEETEGASDHGLVRAAFDWNPMPRDAEA
ncbi:endonuclease/exonuclease/phosphatase family protein [Rhodobacteraceae bacterium CCMM004]|nr:endonuclease/exonuclease/phosphatase family protein [Rhodobacteraceae bacterium CCMM004]